MRERKRESETPSPKGQSRSMPQYSDISPIRLHSSISIFNRNLRVFISLSFRVMLLSLSLDDFNTFNISISCFFIIIVIKMLILGHCHSFLLLHLINRSPHVIVVFMEQVDEPASLLSPHGGNIGFRVSIAVVY